jgi:hypothetical protein
MTAGSPSGPRAPLFSAEARQTTLLLAAVIGQMGLVILIATVATWLVFPVTVLVAVAGIYLIVIS